MTPMDMHLLLTTLEAIKRICTHEKAKLESFKKASRKGEKGKKRPGTESMAKVPKKVRFEKHWCGARLGGSKSNAVNLILRLFLYHFLHTMSS